MVFIAWNVIDSGLVLSPYTAAAGGHLSRLTGKYVARYWLDTLISLIHKGAFLSKIYFWDSGKSSRTQLSSPLYTSDPSRFESGVSAMQD